MWRERERERETHGLLKGSGFGLGWVGLGRVGSALVWCSGCWVGLFYMPLSRLSFLSVITLWCPFTGSLGLVSEGEWRGGVVIWGMALFLFLLSFLFFPSPSLSGFGFGFGWLAFDDLI